MSADAGAMPAEPKATGQVAVCGITFDADKAAIRPEAKAAVAEVARLLKENPDLKRFVVGPTANAGSVELMRQ